jgi:hypothetical protein
MTAKKKGTKKPVTITEVEDGEWLVERPDGKKSMYFGYTKETVMKKERKKKGTKKK